MKRWKEYASKTSEYMEIIEKRCRTIFLLLRKRLKRSRTKLEEAQNDKEDIMALAKPNLDKIQRADGYYYIDNRMKYLRSKMFLQVGWTNIPYGNQWFQVSSARFAFRFGICCKLIHKFLFCILDFSTIVTCRVTARRSSSRAIIFFSCMATVWSMINLLNATVLRIADEDRLKKFWGITWRVVGDQWSGIENNGRIE